MVRTIVVWPAFIITISYLVERAFESIQPLSDRVITSFKLKMERKNLRLTVLKFMLHRVAVLRSPVVGHRLCHDPLHISCKVTILSVKMS